ncbi:DUF4397 domain-containing protein [Teredinibacter sp. KSP-S5-2]|uniref:DUF4397 domain-containing protein n=1 Tax=Teredinibacter sp. KSP-S5-2 TaxID=3034506 RepID=UPI0029342FB2|nr:DUF4397 domain-containing protein [Teredinibacter sp. KSP-S5-2]WNO10220.1 DUF4397 domain-containing protein [Teredinibacter sp. KSP-S5-2]
MKIFNMFLVSLVMVFLTACGGDNNNSNYVYMPKKEGELRVTHASPDAPAVNVYVDGELVLADVDYKVSSGNLVMEEGIYSVEVRGILPDDSEVSVIGPVDITISDDVRTDVVAWDKLFNGTDLNIKAAVLNNDISTVSQVEVAILHAAPQVADVDIYVSSPGEDISTLTPLDAGFGGYIEPVELMADTDYQVRITADGSPDVVYDSGTLSFPAGTELTLIAVENTTGIGANPVNLLAVGKDGASEVLDNQTQAEVRVVHNSADTPEVDILVNGTEVLANVAYPNSAAYEAVSAPTGTYTVTVAAAADNSIAPIEESLSLVNGMSYTVVAVGGLNSVTDETLEAVVTSDNRRSVVTQASLRVIHGSYAVAESIPVDVYLTDSAVITDATAAIENLAYRAVTDELPVAAGDYYITVTAAGDKSTVAFAAGPVTLNAGTNYTVIARDPGTGETGSPLILATILSE